MGQGTRQGCFAVVALSPKTVHSHGKCSLLSPQYLVAPLLKLFQLIARTPMDKHYVYYIYFVFLEQNPRFGLLKYYILI